MFELHYYVNRDLTENRRRCRLYISYDVNRYFIDEQGVEHYYTKVFNKILDNSELCKFGLIYLGCGTLAKSDDFDAPIPFHLNEQCTVFVEVEQGINYH
jgi:hypothetical protein